MSKLSVIAVQLQIGAPPESEEASRRSASFLMRLEFALDGLARANSNQEWVPAHGELLRLAKENNHG